LTAVGTLHGAELRRVRLDLVTPFRTSFGEETARDVLLVGVELDCDGTLVAGWGECVAMEAPLYSSEFTDGAQLVIEQHLLPRLAGVPVAATDVRQLLAPVGGHPMAKAAVEMAVLDAELRARHQSFAGMLGITRTRVPSGVSVGIFDDLDTLLTQVAGYVDAGYARIKLKIEPGWDLEPVRRVRELIGPAMGLQVDANTAYTRDDIDHLCRLDESDLLLVEQPFAEDDLIGHRLLADAASTPVCLDESIVSITTALDAIELGACEVVNIKPGRVGGYLTAVELHHACRDLDVPVWCGGMLETGIGRAANVALAALDGFVLPGDISGFDRFYHRDIVTAPIVMADGVVSVPEGDGFGFELDRDHLDEVTTSVRRVPIGARGAH
jgi:O-succinylbenzoate synthase